MANHIGVGSNYLEVCQRAIGARASDTPLAEQAHAGILAVLADKLPSYSLEYPCHSATEQRWFK